MVAIDAVRRIAPACRMDSGQTAQIVLPLLGQGSKGADLIGEQRIAANGRNGDAEQAGSCRRPVEEAPVAVPGFSEQRR